MQSGGARRRNSIGNAAVMPTSCFCDARVEFICLLYAEPPAGLSNSYIVGISYLARREPCTISPCFSDLHSCARTSPTNASVTAGKAARYGGAGRRAIPMPFLCRAGGFAVEFLCPSGPLSPPHEIASSYSVALGRCRPSGAFRCRRVSDARRGVDRDRHAADDPPRSGFHRRRDRTIVRDRLGDPAPPLPERKQPCSMSS